MYVRAVGDRGPRPGVRQSSTRVLQRRSARVGVALAIVGGLALSGAVARAATRWSIIRSPNSSAPFNSLRAVSCADSAHCVAVGNSSNADSSKAKTLIETFAGGTWSITPSPNPSGPVNALKAVSCADATHCVAVGDSGNAQSTSGKTLVATLSATARQRHR